MRNVYRTYRPIRGLGEADEGNSTSALQTVQAATNLVSNIQDQTGAKPTNRTLNEVSAVSAQVAKYALYIPPPYGEVIAAVASIVAVTAKILSGVFGNGAEIDAAIRAMRNDNDNLLDQVRTIDDETLKMTNALAQLNQALQASGFKTVPVRVNGLGSDLETEQALNTDTKQQLALKGKQLQALIDAYTITMNQVVTAIKLKELGKKIILFGLGALAVGGITWYLVREIENKEK